MEPTILAPHRIVENERVVYGVGEPVPLSEAVRLGLVSQASFDAVGKAQATIEAELAKPTGKRKATAAKRARKPAEDRARKPAEDRS